MDWGREKGEGPVERSIGADPRVPRFEGQGQEALSTRWRSEPKTTWPGVPRYEGQARSQERQRSAQPGVLRVHDTEVGDYDCRDGERRARSTQHLVRERDRGRSVRTPARLELMRTPHVEYDSAEHDRTERSARYGERNDDNVWSDTRYERKRTRSLSRDSGELGLCNPKQRRDTSATDAMLDKFMSIIQSVKGSDKPKLTFNTNIVPEFDPMSKDQTVLTWLTKVEECAEIYGWEDREIIHYALPKLMGVARAWYQSLPTMRFTWSEWKKKLLESFPTRVDYAELLTEMLAKRVKYGESLEHYYYAKISMLNRCKIYGRQAVDCLLYGVEDRAVKVGAQAAQFTEPEQVLKYFRTVKVGQSRDGHDNKSRIERRSIILPVKSHNLKLTCYNCDQTGHPSFKCEKPPAKCTTCDKLGHLSIHCFRSKQINKDRRENEVDQNKNKNEKQVAQLNTAEELTAKYMFNIEVNGHTLDCHLDLGSQCSLIKLSKARELNLNIIIPDDLPVLRGIGANLVSPLGLAVASVEVQGIKETINLYVVNDYVMNQSVLLGHSFTERPNIVITKTPSAVIFQKIPSNKMHLIIMKNFEVPPNALRAVPVVANLSIDARVYVRGSMRGPRGNEYYLLPGEYEVKGGSSALLVHNASPNAIVLKKGMLLTRVQYKEFGHSEFNDVLDTCKVTICETHKSDELNYGHNLTEEELTRLQDLIKDYNTCFSSGLHDLGFTDLTEMVIELEDAEPVVYRPYRMSYADRA